jgi:hypothetical protein
VFHPKVAAGELPIQLEFGWYSAGILLDFGWGFS